MRIAIGGERSWRCDALAMGIVRRLVARYGPDVVIAHGGGCGVDRSFSVACRELGIPIDFQQIDFAHTGDHRHQHRELLRPGAGLCLILHRSTLDERTGDLARQAIAAGVPTYLIADERAIPRRLSAGSGEPA